MHRRPVSSFSALALSLFLLLAAPALLKAQTPPPIPANYGHYQHIVVVFNATNAQVSFQNSAFAGLKLHPHMVQQHSSDPIVRQSSFSAQTGTLIVPGLTTAVFVAEQH